MLPCRNSLPTLELHLEKAWNGTVEEAVGEALTFKELAGRDVGEARDEAARVLGLGLLGEYPDNLAGRSMGDSYVFQSGSVMVGEDDQCRKLDQGSPGR